MLTGKPAPFDAMSGAAAPSLAPGHEAVPAECLGRVVSVGGSQVIGQFSNELGPGHADVTVGTFLGIRNGRSLVIGALCDISLDTGSGGRAGMQTTGRVDLLGEVLGDESGTEYFQRGVMNYPKIGSAILPVDHHALRIIFDISGAQTSSPSSSVCGAMARCRC